VKNVLVFVPAFLAHELDPARLINDILDKEADRLHPARRNRPPASGALRTPTATVTSLVLVAAGLLVAVARLPLSFAAVLVCYCVLVALYSLRPKHLLMIDVLCLAGFYTLRVFAGARAGGVPLSPWFMAFSTFLFFGLALVKRSTEIRTYRAMAVEGVDNRGYQVGDEQLVMTAGMSSGYLSVLVFYLYITGSEAVGTLYPAPQWRWMIGPLLLYWFSRLWFRARRGLLHSDPVLFAVRGLAQLAHGPDGSRLCRCGHVPLRPGACA
jgi:4-hydroxybenzoate polyprenyltransferase